jgi:hypothetical protein
MEALEGPGAIPARRARHLPPAQPPHHLHAQGKARKALAVAQAGGQFAPARIAALIGDQLKQRPALDLRG